MRRAKIGVDLTDKGILVLTNSNSHNYPINVLLTGKKVLTNYGDETCSDVVKEGLYNNLSIHDFVVLADEEKTLFYKSDTLPEKVYFKDTVKYRPAMREMQYHTDSGAHIDVSITDNCQLTGVKNAEAFINKEGAEKVFASIWLLGKKKSLLIDVTKAAAAKVNKMFNKDEIILNSPYVSTRETDMCIFILHIQKFHDRMIKEKVIENV